MDNEHTAEGQIVKAIYGSADHPLRIGDFEIPCYVLEDDRRVLVQGKMFMALGMPLGGHVDEKRNNRLAQLANDRGVKFNVNSGNALARFISGAALQPYVSSELLDAVVNPIKFNPPTGSSVFLGYEASLLAEICDVVLKARADGALAKQQTNLAQQCEILMRGFARVGIIALVDEATGYQQVRARQALEEILEKFITEELRKWAKTFPDEFYQQLFRLKGLTYSEVSTKRPAYLGRITNDIVYERLAPGVLDELRRLNPIDEHGRRKHKHFQHLTEDVGHPRLREHLASLIALMKASPNWATFERLLQRALPKYNTTLPLPLGYDDLDS